MTNTKLETFKKLLFKEIVNEINRKQGVPISFVNIDLNKI